MFQCTASLVLVAFVSLSRGDCPLSGCTSSRSFASETDYFNRTLLPKLLWSYEHPYPLGQTVGGGCATNGGKVVCPVAAETGTTLLSWDGDGGSRWSFSLGGLIPLPLLDYTGGIIAADGYSLVGYYTNGTPRGDPVRLYPTQGEIFDLSIAAGDNVVVLLYKCGFLAVYLTNGVPHASLWLNDTVDGTDGTFIPLGNPAINESRVYVLTAFRPSNRLTSTSTHLRLFAIEITRTITERIKIVWKYDLTVNGSIPDMYLNMSETMCTLVPPASGARERATAKRSETQSTANISNVMVEGGHIIASVNLVVCSSQMELSQSLLLSVTDNSSGCTLNFMTLLTGFIHSLSYSGTRPRRARQQEGLTFWVCRTDMLHSNTLLEERDYWTGALSTLVDLNQILQSTSTVASSKLTLLQIDQEKNSKLQFGSQNPESPSPTAFNVSRSTLIIGVVADSTGNIVVALDVSSKSPNATLLWKLPLSVTDGAAMGQIATINRAEDSLMIVTTPVRISAYLLT